MEHNYLQEIGNIFQVLDVTQITAPKLAKMLFIECRPCSEYLQIADTVWHREKLNMVLWLQTGYKCVSYVDLISKYPLSLDFTFLIYSWACTRVEKCSDILHLYSSSMKCFTTLSAHVLLLVQRISIKYFVCSVSWIIFLVSIFVSGLPSIFYPAFQDKTCIQRLLKCMSFWFTLHVQYVKTLCTYKKKCCQ